MSPVGDSVFPIEAREGGCPTTAPGISSPGDTKSDVQEPSQAPPKVAFWASTLSASADLAPRAVSQSIGRRNLHFPYGSPFETVPFDLWLFHLSSSRGDGCAPGPCCGL